MVPPPSTPSFLPLGAPFYRTHLRRAPTTDVIYLGGETPHDHRVGHQEELEDKNVDLMIKILAGVASLEYALPPLHEGLSTEFDNIWVGVPSRVRAWRMCNATTILSLFGIGAAALVTFTPLRATVSPQHVKNLLHLILVLNIIGAITRMFLTRHLDPISAAYACLIPFVLFVGPRFFLKVRDVRWRRLPAMPQSNVPRLVWS